MEWAEEVGIGEMGLDPDVFWSLNFREFWIKHRAFIRAEDRLRALVREAALLMRPSQKDGDNVRSERDINALRRYPIKKWLDQPPS